MELVEVWGSGALFTRPEMKVERVTYEVPTESAMVGLLKSIYWHPGMEWVVDRIAVMNPIRHMSLRRNEVDTPVVSRSVADGSVVCMDVDRHRVQRSADCLKDVRYVLEARFVRDRSSDAPAVDEAKVSAIVGRRLKRGQCFRQPCLGSREFPAFFREWDKPFPDRVPGVEDVPLGWMFYRFDYSDPQHPKPRFANVAMRDGVIDLRDVEVKG